MEKTQGPGHSKESRESVGKNALVFTKTIVESIQHVNPIIISGLAEGIDVGAHQAALDAGLQTYACLAHGVIQCYPAFNSKIKAKIEEQGRCFDGASP
jgi:predicted Rossmann fold nucleotide-binding protein DprA/Smf involved in DNA uptake